MSCVVFDAPCPSCGEPVRWTDYPPPNSNMGKPNPTIDCRRCSPAPRETPLRQLVSYLR